MNRPTLRGSRCQCTGCGQFFSCAATFDRHRIGEFAGLRGTSSRRCLSVDEMLAQGWGQNGKGFWRREGAGTVHPAQGGEPAGPCIPSAPHEEERP